MFRLLEILNLELQKLLSFVRSITIDTNNNIIVKGYVNSNADLNGDGDSTDGGAESATGYGNDDIFISKFSD